ncbi:MAG: hypothetical protein M3527_06770 [Actinomycetota bacterium]|nr:hypothetical protein [Acidimicrobiia bacterium]MDQ3294133.1 hypothetical protein [Actinomycetota bacterium]
MPSTSSPSGSDPGSGSALRRYGPIAAIVAVIALIAGVVLLSGGDDDDVASPGTTATGASAGDDGGGTSFSENEAQGLGLPFPDTCDQERGRVAVPLFFAPECYADVADNGGATDDGVTADAITVVVYRAPETDPVLDFILGSIQNDDTSQQAADTYAGLTELFNTTYQTYGRRVELQFLEATGDSTNEGAARADAIRAAEEMGAFAVWGGPALNGAWSEELNARGVLCMGCFGVSEPEPNVFTVVPSAAQNRVHLVEYVTKKLARRPADHAGDPVYQSQERVFGHLWIETSPSSATEAATLASTLGEQGVDIVESIPFDLLRATELAPGIIQRFKEAGVTSVIIQGDPSTPAIFTTAATDQEWFPEWIIGGSALMDLTAFGRTYDQEQWAHAFGISSLTARSAPGVGGADALYQWFHGTPPPADDTAGVLLPQPLIFFNALQAAGPNLTTDTMRAALYAIAPGEASITQPRFSYGDHGIYPGIDPPDHAGIDDYTEIWYDPTVGGEDEIGRDGVGAYRYVDGGRRYLPGEWTDEDRAFDPEGAIAVYTEPPEAEQAVDYPPPGG